jgi:hypothetical protein
MQTATKRLTLLSIGFMVVGLVLAGTSDAKISDKDIVGLWLFEDGKGKVAKDTSGNDNDGEFVGDLKWVNAKFGKGLEFDGADTWLACGNGESLNFSGGESFSIHAIVKSAGAPNGKCVIWKGLGCSTWSQYLLGTGAHENGENTPKAAFHIRAANGAAKLEVLGDELSENEWIHLVGVYDGNNVSVYIDGKLDSSEKAKGPPWASPEQVYIGADPGCNKRCQWEGIIDEVAVFNAALPDGDIASLTNGIEGALSVEAADKLATTWAGIKRAK